jgi:hypothetical protein
MPSLPSPLSQLTVAEFVALLEDAGVKTLDPNGFLTIGETARLCRCHPDTVKRNYADVIVHLSEARLGIQVKSLFAKIAKQKFKKPAA